MFLGLEKSMVLEFCNGLGGGQHVRTGLPILDAYAKAGGISKEELIKVLRVAPGGLEHWADSMTLDERTAIEAAPPGSPSSAASDATSKKRPKPAATTAAVTATTIAATASATSKQQRRGRGCTPITRVPNFGGRRCPSEGPSSVQSWGLWDCDPEDTSGRAPSQVGARPSFNPHSTLIEIADSCSLPAGSTCLNQPSCNPHRTGGRAVSQVGARIPRSTLTQPSSNG